MIFKYLGRISRQECVPIILSDQVELPFQDVVDYSKISIKLPSTSIGPQLLDYLGSITDEDIEEKISWGRRIKCLWIYAPESEPRSAFYWYSLGTSEESEALPPIIKNLLAT